MWLAEHQTDSVAARTISCSRLTTRGASMPPGWPRRYSTAGRTALGQSGQQSTNARTATTRFGGAREKGFILELGTYL